ncbi:MAG TPA: hypothetical protein VFV87_09785 [Pirellulaceae bacterium]|nr:hypothetical protein [Pirellulaceae bacterium]
MTALPGVPVFNCIVNVSPPGQQAPCRAQVANLAGISASGPSEREALAKIVPQFKAAVARLHAANEPIPWIDPPMPPAAGELQRFIAVHL